MARQNPGTLEWFTGTSRTILSLVAEGPALGELGEGRASSGRDALREHQIHLVPWRRESHRVHTDHWRLSEKDLSAMPPVNSHLYHICRFYYDTAGALNPIVMQGLKKLLGGTSHIVFGTGFPYGNIATLPQAYKTSDLTGTRLEASTVRTRSSF